MGKLLTEIQDLKKPLFLVFTNNKRIQELIFNELSDKLSLLFISDSQPKKENSATYYMSISDMHLLPHLEEKAEYALVMLSNESEKEGLSFLLEKLSADNSRTAFLIPASNYNSFVDTLLEVKSYSNIIPALYGELLESDSSKSEFLKIIQIAVSNQKVILNGNDLLPVFPISENDLITGIKHLLFTKIKRAIYYLFYQQPQNMLSALHHLARIEPELKFEINHENAIERYEERPEMDALLSEKLQMDIHYLDGYLKGFNNSIENLHKKLQKENIPSNTPKRKGVGHLKIKFVKFTPSVSLALFLSVILFLSINVFSCFIGILFLRNSVSSFEKNDFKNAREKGIIAKNALSIPLPILSITESAVSYIPFMKNFYHTLHLITSSSEITTTASGLIEKLDQIDSGISKTDFNKILIDSQHLYHTGSRILLNQENRAISNLLKPQVTKSLSLMSVTPNLLGYDKKKEYLLLFMNNAELRPTGGFIGSVGRLIVENGKVEDFEIQDVYELDGQLTRHIEPHYIIRRNLQPHLYLRDSNFDLDFQRSASLSAMIYNLETKHTPDGVVAVDFNLIKKILEITGPIELKNYGQTINADNSLEFLQNTIEKNFFPGSTQKKEILNELFTNIILELEKSPEHLVNIGLALPELLEEKHILISYQNKNIQSLLNALNYGGQISWQENTDKYIIPDTLFFNEANIGTNKVNQFISRSISYRADLNSRLSNSKISIRNDSKTDGYKAYLRLLAPKNSVFRKFKVNGQDVKTINSIIDPKVYEATNFKPDSKSYEIEVQNDYNKTVFGTVITVPRGEIIEFEFEYTNPKLFLEGGIDGYELHFIKQPGTDLIPLKTLVEFPDDVIAKGEQINSFGNGVVEFDDNLKTDKIFKLYFSKE